jgi:hypothetical protein
VLRNHADFRGLLTTPSQKRTIGSITQPLIQTDRAFATLIDR